MMLPVAVIRATKAGLWIVGTDLAGAFGELIWWVNTKEVEEEIRGRGYCPHSWFL
jgi:hypothetical protein